MCKGTVAVVDASHVLAIADAITALCDRNVLFTAFDVTRTAREAVGDYMARHKILKSEIRRIFQAGEFPVGYDRQLVDIGGVDSYVYYPLGLDSHDYDAQSLFPDGDVSKPAAAPVSTTAAPAASAAPVSTVGGHATDSECRLNIPQKLLATMKLSKGDKVYIELNSNDAEIKITPVPKTAEYDTLTINANGSIRISQSALVKAFGSVGVYGIDSNDESVAADIVISVKAL